MNNQRNVQPAGAENGIFLDNWGITLAANALAPAPSGPLSL